MERPLIERVILAMGEPPTKENVRSALIKRMKYDPANIDQMHTIGAMMMDYENALAKCTGQPSPADGIEKAVKKIGPSLSDLSPDQKSALQRLEKFVNDNQGKGATITVGGYAGTGKTTTIQFLEETFPDLIFNYMAFTGKAAAALNSKPRIAGRASTIHSFMYRTILDEKGNIVEFKRKEMAEPNDPDQYGNFTPYTDVIVVDEASMLPYDLYQDLLSYGKPIIAVGDHGQLEPVKSDFSLMQRPDIRLENIHRNAGPIAELSKDIREGRKVPYHVGDLTAKINQSKFNTPTSFLEGKSPSLLLATGGPSVIGIVGKNQQRVFLNMQIASALFPNGVMTDKGPAKNSRIIFLQNKRGQGIYNGMLATVTGDGYLQPDMREHNYGIHVKTDDDPSYEMFVEVAAYGFLSEKPKAPDGVYYKKLGIPADLGYVITCHKSQGSEWPNVVVIGQGFGNSESRRRWLYTAVTRAQGKLLLVD